MTRDVEITLDKHDLVTDFRATGDRWRFNRITPFSGKYRQRVLSDEQEREICALYVDRPNMTTKEIAKRFGIGYTNVSGVVQRYGIPLRSPRKSRSVKSAVVRDERPSDTALAPSTSGSTWRVRVTRTITETIEAETLLDVAAHYDGTDAVIVYAEKMPA